MWWALWCWSNTNVPSFSNRFFIALLCCSPHNKLNAFLFCSSCTPIFSMCKLHFLLQMALLSLLLLPFWVCWFHQGQFLTTHNKSLHVFSAHPANMFSCFFNNSITLACCFTVSQIKHKLFQFINAIFSSFQSSCHATPSNQRVKSMSQSTLRQYNNMNDFNHCHSHKPRNSEIPFNTPLSMTLMQFGCHSQFVIQLKRQNSVVNETPMTIEKSPCLCHCLCNFDKSKKSCEIPNECSSSISTKMRKLRCQRMCALPSVSKTQHFLKWCNFFSFCEMSLN